VKQFGGSEKPTARWNILELLQLLNYGNLLSLVNLRTGQIILERKPNAMLF
jgi:hypothetical protein